MTQGAACEVGTHRVRRGSKSCRVAELIAPVWVVRHRQLKERIAHGRKIQPERCLFVCARLCVSVLQKHRAALEQAPQERR